MIHTLRFLVLCFLLGLPVAAQDLPTDASLIRLNTRVFDLRTDVRVLRRDDYFIPLTEIKWLLEVVNSDPYLQHTVVKIRVHQNPLKDIWPPTAHFANYILTENIPSKFLLEGFKTRSRHPSNRGLLLQPEDDPSDFYVNCGGGDIEKQIYCSVHASYPPDPNISLVAGIYFAEPPYNFREIAHRMRALAYCLDVTDRLSPDGTSPEVPVTEWTGLPAMTGCDVNLGS